MLNLVCPPRVRVDPADRVVPDDRRHQGAGPVDRRQYPEHRAGHTAMLQGFVFLVIRQRPGVRGRVGPTTAELRRHGTRLRQAWCVCLQRGRY